MKVALVVGHKKNSPGACNDKYNICEFEFNVKLVQKIDCLLDERCETDIVYRDSYKGLPDKINDLSPNLVVCFHANAFNTKAFGAETLYYHKSKKGKKIAEIFQNGFVYGLKSYNRGVKPKSSEQRGGYVLRYTNAPCVLIEPFFMDNDEECSTMVDGLGKLAVVCRDSIYESIEEVM